MHERLCIFLSSWSVSDLQICYVMELVYPLKYRSGVLVHDYGAAISNRAFTVCGVVEFVRA